jgi:shikimate kinase
MVITLIGYRCCGKSSVAPRLARQLGWASVDTDEVIERRAGCSIREIFEREGEAGFRRMESEVLSEVLAQTNLVVASGGGAVLSEANRQMMKSAGPVVWLQVSAARLVSRLAGARSADRRPSLTGKPIAEEVTEVLAVREPLYRECASLIINADRERPQAIARRIASQFSSETQQEPA